MRPIGIFIVLPHHSLVFLSVPGIFFKAYLGGMHFVDKGNDVRMQLLLFFFFLKGLGTVSEKTKRIQLLNKTFFKLTPTPIHKHGNETSFSPRRGASWSNSNLYIFGAITAVMAQVMTTRRMRIAQIIVSPCISFR